MAKWTDIEGPTPSLSPDHRKFYVILQIPSTKGRKLPQPLPQWVDTKVNLSNLDNETTKELIEHLKNWCLNSQTTWQTAVEFNNPQILNDKLIEAIHSAITDTIGFKKIVRNSKQTKIPKTILKEKVALLRLRRALLSNHKAL